MGGAATCARDWARPCPHGRAFLQGARVSMEARAHAGYTLQDIAFNEFFEAAGMTCTADLFYEGKVCAAVWSDAPWRMCVIEISASSKLFSAVFPYRRSAKPTHGQS